MKKQPKITQAYLKVRVDYDPETGEMVWRKRPMEDFNTLKGYKRSREYVGQSAATEQLRGLPPATTLAQVKMQSSRLAWLYVYGILPDSIEHVDGDVHNMRIDNLEPCELPDEFEFKRRARRVKREARALEEQNDNAPRTARVGRKQRRRKRKTSEQGSPELSAALDAAPVELEEWRSVA